MWSILKNFCMFHTKTVWPLIASLWLALNCCSLLNRCAFYYMLSFRITISPPIIRIVLLYTSEFKRIVIIKIPYNQHKVYEPSSKLSGAHRQKEVMWQTCTGQPVTKGTLECARDLTQVFLRNTPFLCQLKISKC